MSWWFRAVPLLAFAALACERKSSPPPNGDVTPGAATPGGSASSDPAAVMRRCSELGDRFPHDALEAGAAGCATASDCVAVLVAGACYPVVKATLTSPLAAKYTLWVAAGCNRPSGSPATLAAVPPNAACGADIAGVECRAGRCVAVASDCAYAGETRATCTGKGGQWGGCTDGRGREPGCHMPDENGKVIFTKGCHHPDGASICVD